MYTLGHIVITSYVRIRHCRSTSPLHHHQVRLPCRAFESLAHIVITSYVRIRHCRSSSPLHHHQVRIFVEDRDEDSRVASALDLQLRDMDAGDHLTHNLDFFNGSSTTFPSGDQLLAQCAGTGELTY